MLPAAQNIHVNTKGAVILSEESPEVRIDIVVKIGDIKQELGDLSYHLCRHETVAEYICPTT